VNFWVVIIIALGLAMDAFAVSITSGLTIKILRIRYAFRIALFFGLFQAVMPVMGWLAGYGMKDMITAYDHWIAFGLLGFIGGRMIYESFSKKIVDRPCDPMTIYKLLLLSIATSIDALAVGLTLSFLNVEIIMPSVIIGLVTFGLSFAGVFLGNRFGHFFENKIELIGGIILISIGIKILVEHLLEFSIF
jgi:putative Mn2+ efflux pump MntP